MKLDGMLDIWSVGQLLAFSGIDGATSFGSGLVARTSAEGCSIDIKTPGELRVSFPSHEKSVLAGDFFRIESAKGVTKGAFIDTFNLLIEGPCEIGAVPAELETIRKGGKLLIASKGHLKAGALDTEIDAFIEKRAQWLEAIKAPKGIGERTAKTLCKALSQLKTQVYSPEGRIVRHWTTPDRWPHKKMWLWDSAFHAIGLRHLDTKLAQEALEAMFDVQGKDGFIPHMASPGESSEITQPPVLAFATMLLNEKIQSKEWLASIYPKLAAYLKWDIANRDRDGNGLLEWFIENNPLCRSGESGADNSSRFDCASNLDAPDFNAFIAQEFEIMASFAETLGLDEDASMWKELHKKFNKLMNSRLWSEELGLYMDFDNATGKHTDVMSFAAFLPLICGTPTKEQAAKLVAHLKNPETFGTALPIPTIAKCQSKYYSKDMWRGPVWININWLVARGLRRYGYEKEAAELIEKTLNEIEIMHSRYGTMFEFYDDRRQDDPPKLLRKGKNDPTSPYHQAFHDYGWTATLYIEMIYSGS